MQLLGQLFIQYHVPLKLKLQAMYRCECRSVASGTFFLRFSVMTKPRNFQRNPGSQIDHIDRIPVVQWKLGFQWLQCCKFCSISYIPINYFLSPAPPVDRQVIDLDSKESCLCGLHDARLRHATQPLLHPQRTNWQLHSFETSFPHWVFFDWNID